MIMDLNVKKILGKLNIYDKINNMISLGLSVPQETNAKYKLVPT